MFKTKKKNHLFLPKNNGRITKKVNVFNSLLDKVTIGKEIGKGKYGTVYLATDDKGNKYAYKIEKLLPNDVPNTSNSAYWREIEFAKHMEKYPDQFMKLYDARIISNCKHVHVYKETAIVGELEKEFQKSSYCGIKLWSLVDDTMYSILKNKVDSDQLYDMYIQLVYINFLLWKEGYMHGDLHVKNVGYVKTHKKNITILGHKIPTHGYIFNAIDFGNVLHPSYPTWMPYNEFTSDLIRTLTTFSANIYKGYKYNVISLNGKAWNWYNKMIFEDIKLTKDELDNLEKYMPKQLMGIDNMFKDILKVLLYKLINYEQWQRKSFNDDTITGVKPNYLMPIDMLLYVIKYIYEPKKVLLYLIKYRDKVIKFHKKQKM